MDAIARVRMIEAHIGEMARFLAAECRGAVKIRKMEKKVSVVFRSTGDAVIENCRAIR
jgi:hypothetical protein